MRHALLQTVAVRAFDTGSMATTPEMVQAAKRHYETHTTDEMLKRSPDSAAMLEYWDTTDTIVDGIGALRLAGTAYLPKFTDEEDDDYKFRLTCTKMTNVYRDTVESLAAKPFEKEVALATEGDTTPPEQLEQFVEDVDGSGNNLTAFASQTFFNGINSAIAWIFVDFSKPDPTIRSRADAKRAGLRPFWSHVLGRNVLEARSAIINGNEMLTYIRIFEPGKPDHVRVFERSPQGVVTWTLYQKQDKPSTVNEKTYFVKKEAGELSIDRIPLVPFWTGRRDGRTWRFFPAMRDAADLQLNLYQNESGLEFAKKLAAYPMLAANGIRPEKDAGGKVKKLAVGPGRVLYATPDASGNVGSWSYVEPSATSLKFLADDIKETIQQLREIGRQPLTAQSGNLTVITTAIAAGKAKSAVSAWANALANALENAFVITNMWLNIDKATYDPVVSVYTDFDEFMEGKDLDALNSARERGDISQLTYWDEYRRRGVLSADFDPEIEEKRLMKEIPGDGEDTVLDDPEPPPATPPVEDKT